MILKSVTSLQDYKDLYNLVGKLSVTERTQPSKNHPYMSMSSKYYDALKKLSEARKELRENYPCKDVEHEKIILKKDLRNVTSTTHEKWERKTSKDFDKRFFNTRR